jgi:hypothetical protein
MTERLVSKFETTAGPTPHTASPWLRFPGSLPPPTGRSVVPCFVFFGSLRSYANREVQVTVLPDRLINRRFFSASAECGMAARTVKYSYDLMLPQAGEIASRVMRHARYTSAARQ